MKYRAVFYRFFVYVRFRKHHVRPGISVKRKLSVSSVERFDERQRCIDFFIRYKPLGVYSDFFDRRFQLSAENVIAHFADKRRLFALSAHHRKHVARRTSGVRFHKRVSL
jgi:hypothetical protein